MTITQLNKEYSESLECLAGVLCRNIVRRRSGYINEELKVCKEMAIRFLYYDDIKSLNQNKAETEEVYLPF